MRHCLLIIVAALCGACALLCGSSCNSSSVRSGGGAALFPKTTQEFQLKIETLMSEGDLDSALRYAQYVEQQSLQMGETTLLADIYWNMGRIYGREGKTIIMFDYFFRGLDAAERAGNNERIGGACIAIGSMYMQNMMLDRAALFLHRAEMIASQLNNFTLMAYSRGELAELESKKGNYNAMLSLVSTALASVPFSSDTLSDSYFMRAHLYNKVGWGSMYAGKYNQALLYLDTALSLYAHAPNKRFIPDSYIVKSKAFVRLGRIADARAALTMAEYWSQKLHLKIMEVSLWNVHAEIADSAGDYITAYRAYRQFHTLKDSIFSHESIAKSELLKDEYDEKLRFAEQDAYRNILIGGFIALMAINAN
jgi:tetratricopeptide (TPR) repeat protein